MFKISLKFKNMDDEIFDEFDALEITNTDNEISIMIEKFTADKLKSKGLAITTKCPSFLTNLDLNTLEREKAWNEHIIQNTTYYFFQNKHIDTQSELFINIVTEYYNWIKTSVKTTDGDFISSTDEHNFKFDHIGKRQKNELFDIYVNGFLFT